MLGNLRHFVGNVLGARWWGGGEGGAWREGSALYKTDRLYHPGGS